MTILSKPEVLVPNHIITKEDTINICNMFHGDNDNISTIKDMIEHTTIIKRHLVQPLGKTLVHYGIEQRHKVYSREAKRLALEVSRNVLEKENMSPKDIDLIICTSCTGFLFPSLTSYLINALSMNSNTKQLPVAQLGCAAGSAAINRAADYCTAYPEKSVLIVSVELCSLLFQPTDNNFGVLVSNALFGDAASACIVSNKIKRGLSIDKSDSFLYSNSEHYIAYDIKSTGCHFLLDKAVPKTMAVIAPEMNKFLKNSNISVDELAYSAIHAGGPRILNDLVKFMNLPDRDMRFSRESLANYGNTASVFLFDSLKRLLDSDHLFHGQKGLIAGFGPGLTAEYSLGHFVEN